MATAKSDEESDVSSHPLAENRPGVYVQVVASRRRKKSKRGETSTSSRPPEANAGANARQDAGTTGPQRVQEVDGRGQKRAANRTGAKQAELGSRAEPRASTGATATPEGSEKTALPVGPGAANVAPSGMVVSQPKPELVADAQPAVVETEDDDDGRQSGERPVDSDSLRAREREADSESCSHAEARTSTNARHSAALMGIGIPPPPRLPNFAPSEHDIDTDPPLHSASLLDAPHSLRPAPESTPAGRPSVTLVAFVAVFSAIIVSAGLVALRELTSDEAPKSASVTAQQVQAIAAQRDVRPRVEQLTPSAPPKAAPSVEGVAAKAQPEAHKPALPSTRPLPLARAAGQRAVRPAKGVSPSTGEEPNADEAEQGEDRLPDPNEPLELPVNPYR
jgi:hypothetical protein